LTFSSIFVPDDLAAAVADDAWVAAMLEAEAALAAAQAAEGVISAEAAEAVAEACKGDFDALALAVAGRAAANPVVPLVKRLRETAPEAHHGATSQDILDTAAALVTIRALTLAIEHFDAAISACARFADEHRGTIMAGRTLMQLAQPITFGLKAANWLTALAEARVSLMTADVPAQLAGATGTLSELGGPAVVRRFAESLDLGAPEHPWHANRVPVADLAMGLALAAGTAEKVALDIVLLAQNEVGEVSESAEGGRGSSSAMAHKQNPVGAIRARAAARSARGAVSVLLEAMAGEHERAAGAWQSEWGALSTALAGTGGAIWSLREALEGLTIDAERMAANADGLPGELDMVTVNTMIDRALELE
jgi:3-carboxy-cis,cis-muconate cycloisomerase